MVFLIVNLRLHRAQTYGSADITLIASATDSNHYSQPRPLSPLSNQRKMQKDAKDADQLWINYGYTLALFPKKEIPSVTIPAALRTEREYF
jgi:hypothetical protein